MHLGSTVAEGAFRERVRAFIAAELPSVVAAKVLSGVELTRDEVVGWMRALSRQGWIAPAWPTDAGGPGWTVAEQVAFEEECYRAGAPTIVPFGVSMVGPVLLAFGDEAQKQRHLPGIVSSEVIWSQGYSEPNSGSDLASLATRAVREGGHYRVNGRKIWTTQAHWADWMFTLVRTDGTGKRQEGITVLLIDMKAPGVTVRPVPRFSGTSDFNEVILEDVLVPVAERVGEEGAGWTIAKYLLGHERVGTTGIGICAQALARLRRIACAMQAEGAPLIDEPAFRARLEALEVRFGAVRASLMRLAGGAAEREVGPEASLLKIRGTELQQDCLELLMEAGGYYAEPFIERALRAGWNEEPVGPADALALAPLYFDWRKASIYSGSNEIQKNIISKAVLGL